MTLDRFDYDFGRGFNLFLFRKPNRRPVWSVWHGSKLYFLCLQAYWGGTEGFCIHLRRCL